MAVKVESVFPLYMLNIIKDLSNTAGLIWKYFASGWSQFFMYIKRKHKNSSCQKLLGCFEFSKLKRKLPRLD